MDYKDIEQLLERYWQCETSVEEEATLRDFFAKEEVPAHLLRYKNLFVYQQVQQEVGLGEDFDARILAQVETPVVKAKRLTLTGRFIPLFKAAAVIQMKAYRNSCFLSLRCNDRCISLYGSIFDRRWCCLDHNRCFEFFCCLDDRLYHLHILCIKCTYCITAFLSLGQHFF